MHPYNALSFIIRKWKEHSQLVSLSFNTKLTSCVHDATCICCWAPASAVWRLRCRSIYPVHKVLSSKPSGRHCCCGLMGQMNKTLALHRPGFAYCTSSVNNFVLRYYQCTELNLLLSACRNMKEVNLGLAVKRAKWTQWHPSLNFQVISGVVLAWFGLSRV